jgi:hypothetical protein
MIAAAPIGITNRRLKCGLLAFEAEKCFIKGDLETATFMVGQLAQLARPNRLQYRLGQMRSRVLRSADPSNREQISSFLDGVLQDVVH